MVSALNSALAGIATATKNIDKAAQNIAIPSKDQSAASDSSDGVNDIVDLSVNAQAFKANLSVIKKTDEMEQSLLDILA